MIITGTYDLKYSQLWKQKPLEQIYIECDTSIAPVTINLFEIAETKLFWNVKFFISDKSNNCSINNIIVNAGGSDSIDILGQTSFVMNTNGGSVELQIVSNNKWMATESNSGISTYKVYTALLNQTGISAPVATVLENTIGDITWTYESTGVYYANSSNLFNGNIFISPYIYYNNEIDAMVVLSSDPQYNTNNILQFLCSANNVGIDGRLINIPIEIRVYN